MSNLIIVAASFGGILLFLLASASANTALFARHYPWLIGLNAIVALSLLALIGWQVRDLWREHQAKIFGSRLKLRLMLMFGLMAVLPGVLIYAVSVQFVTKSIETWFDVRVEKALEAGLNLGRSALDSLLEELAEKGRSMALDLSEQPEGQRRLMLSPLPRYLRRAANCCPLRQEICRPSFPTNRHSTNYGKHGQAVAIVKLKALVARIWSYVFWCRCRLSVSVWIPASCN